MRTIILRINLRLRLATVSSVVAALFVCFGHAVPAMCESDPFHLRIGYSSKVFINVPKDDVRIAIKVLSQKVARKTVGSAESRVYDTIADIEKDLKTKKLDVVALTAEEFIQLRPHVSLEAVMTAVAGNSHEVELYLMTRKDSGLDRFVNLKNRILAMPSLNAQFASVYRAWAETLAMKELKGQTGDFFSSIKETHNASKAIMAVFFRKADACIVTKNAFDVTSELNPQIARDLKVIAQINHLTGGIVAFRQDLPEERKLKVKQALSSLHEDQEGRQMFVLFQLTGLAPFRPEYLTGLEALYAEHQNLKSKLVKR